MPQILARFFRPQFSHRASPAANLAGAVRVVRFFQWLAISLVLSLGLHAVSTQFGATQSSPAGDGNGSTGTAGKQSHFPNQDLLWWQSHEAISTTPTATPTPTTPIRRPNLERDETHTVSLLQWHGGASLQSLDQNDTGQKTLITSRRSQEAYQVLGLTGSATSQPVTESSPTELHFSLSGTLSPGVFYVSSGENLSLSPIPEPSTAALTIIALAATIGIRWRASRFRM